MSDFIIENGVLIKYNGNEKEVIVPKGLLKIGDFAFKNCTALEEITLPNGIKGMRMNAFYMCMRLKRINFPEDFEQGAPWLKDRFLWKLVVVSALECCNKDTKIVKFIIKNKKEAIDILVNEKRPT